MANPAFSQRWEWDLELFSTNVAGMEITDVATDAVGNVYALGNFSGTVNFNPNGTVSNRFSFSAQNIFLAKYNRAGVLQFFRGIVGGANSQATSLVLDETNGFVYITGTLQGSVQLQTGGVPATETFASNGQGDVFVIRYTTATLLYQWRYVAGGPLDDWGRGIGLDDAGDILLTGTYQGTVDFDGGGVLAASTSNGGDDVFVAKLNRTTGNLTALHTMGSAGDDRGEDIAGTAGQIYAVGYFSGLMDINPAAAFTNNIVNIAGQDGYLVRFTDLGTAFGLGKGMVIGGNGTNAVTEVELDRNGKVLVGGTYQQTAAFGGGVNRTSAGGNDFFVARYPDLIAAGTPPPDWASGVGGTNDDILADLATDPCGNLYLAGSYQGTVDFNPGAGTAALTGPGAAGRGYFASKFDNDGLFLLAGGEEVGLRDNRAGAISHDPGGNLIIGINASSAADTDVGPNSEAVTRTPTATANGDVIYLVRSATGRVNVHNTLATGDGSLDEGILWAERNPYADTVCFCLPGAGPFTINKPGSAMPVLADSTVIDGTTQAGWTAGSIVVDGAGALTDGISLEGPAQEIYGLTITGYNHGVFLNNAAGFVVGAPGKENDISGNAAAGVRFSNSSGVVQNNSILNNATGVEDLTGTSVVTITGNAFACNSAAGILITGGYANPVITTPDVSVIAGTATPNEIVEIYTVDNSTCGFTPPCQGYSLLGTATADALGNWSLIGAFTIGTQITATSTNAAGKTSEFSLCALVDAVLDPAEILLSANDNQLRWQSSEHQWVSFSLERKELTGFSPVASLEAFQQNFQVHSAGSYVVSGALADGRIVRSNEVEVFPQSRWVVSSDGQNLVIGRESGGWTAEMLDISGKKILDLSGEGVTSQAVENLASGLYLIRLRNDGGEQHQQKVLIR